MKNEATACQHSRYSVAPFSRQNPKRPNRQNDIHQPCAICGRPVRNPEHFAVVVDGGSGWGDHDSDPKHPGYMGCFPVGPDCHQRFVVGE